MLFRLSLSLMTAAFMSATLPQTHACEDFSHNVLPPKQMKVSSQDFYVEKKEDDLYLGMQKVTDENWDFWNTYYQVDEAEANQYCQRRAIEMERGYGPRLHKNFLRLKTSQDILTAGHYSFGITLRQGYHNSGEVWVAFVYTDGVPTPSELSSSQIEMTCSVMTDPESPLSCHIGINRGFHHMNQAEEKNPEQDPEKDYMIHKNLSARLHQFAAQVILERFPHKKFMITAPVTKMREIMTYKFPGTLVGDSYTTVRAKYKENAYPLPDRLIDMKELSQRLQSLIIKKSQEKAREKHDKEKAEKLTKTLSVYKSEHNTLKENIKSCEEALMSHLALTYKPTLTESPVLKNHDNTQIIILDERREASLISFHQKIEEVTRETSWGQMKEECRTLDQVIIGDRLFTGKETEPFQWFFHPHMFFGGASLTVNSLHELASTQL